MARFLVPVVAVAGEVEEVDGLLVDKTSDMAMVSLTARTVSGRCRCSPGRMR